MPIEFNVQCVRIKQPIGEFYVGKLLARDLVRYVNILRRGLSDEAQQHIQRSLSAARQREIAAYVFDPDATFPTSVIVSVYPEAANVDETTSTIRFSFDEKLGELIDGQHRLEGLTLASQTKKSILDDFEMPVVFMLDLSSDEKAYVFSIINSKQIQVPSSLIIDLFGLQVSRSPKKTCHEIAQTLNTREESPFYRGIKMLGRKEFESEYLTQGSFAKYLLKLISGNPEEDERREKRHEALAPDPRRPLRDFYSKHEDGAIAKIMDNYFSAVAELYPTAWRDDPKPYLLRKTVGYAALMRVLEKIWKEKVSETKDASRSAFVELLSPLTRAYNDQRFISENYASSEQGAKDMADDILSALGFGEPNGPKQARPASGRLTPDAGAGDVPKAE